MSHTPSRKTRRRPLTKAELARVQGTLTAPNVLTNDVLTVNDDNFSWVPNSSIDLLLTDPPFNIAQDTNFHTYEANTVNSYRFDTDKGWDTYTHEEFIELLNSWSGEFARVLRPGGSFAVFCADTYLSHLIDALRAAGLKPRRTLTWRKPNAVPVNRKTMMMSSCEYVIIGVKGSKATFNSDLNLADVAAVLDVEEVLVADKAAAVVERAVRQAVRDVVQTGDARAAAISAAVAEAVREAADEAGTRTAAMYVDGAAGAQLRGCVPNHVSFNSKAGNRVHPTEKPVQLLRYLASLLSNPGDVILDPFAGSGSTGQAAFETHRDAILIERDREFFSKAAKRISSLRREHGST